MEPVALFERGGTSVACAPAPPGVVRPSSDGIRIYELEPGEAASSSLGYPYVEQEFEVAGEGRRYVVRVGLGGDGAPGGVTVPSTPGSTATPP